MLRGERFNSISHLAGAVLAAAGLAMLVTQAALQDDAWKVVGFSIYGSTLFLLYAASACYHGFRGRAKAVFQRFDHAAIYLLIAGTYTPFALVSLRGAWGWSLFGVVWGFAVVGIVQEFIPKRGRAISVVLYIVMGWLALIALVPLLRALSPAGVTWLVAGGALYTLGVVFFALDQRLRFGHEIWHLFVLGGSGAHYFAVLRYVA